ncbi:unnamed protein product [Caenorhabditis angaria]|uniref:Cytochrome b5 n=1 Tax=Caenorhabditis angaria TaxID=860376 RepID=A0A9P1N4K9_9PELO|nr:unnamed protein product [Caenorhabditis angaria]
MSAIFTRKEVNMHCSDDDCWIIYGDYVYDITDFLYTHPGGAEILLEYAGGDATDAFESVGHSIDARVMLAKYEIGILHDDDRSTFIIPQFISQAKKFLFSS